MIMADADVRPPKKRGALARLYHGETNIDFIGRTKLWFALSGAPELHQDTEAGRIRWSRDV